MPTTTTESPVSMAEIGEIIRKKRKEKGLRIGDLVDSHISSATISNIERGLDHVSQHKTLHLLKKLNINMHDLPFIMLEETEERKALNFQLFYIENLRDTGSVKQALDELDKLPLVEEDHPMSGKIRYIYGKCHYANKNWKKAESAFSNAIRLSSGKEFAENHNTEALCFNYLGLICYQKKEYHKAMKFYEIGIKALNPQGQNQYLRFVLEKGKALVYKILGNYTAALKAVEDIWPELDDSAIKRKTLYDLYALKSELYAKSELPAIAQSIALEGLTIAHEKNEHEFVPNLWHGLGVANFKLNNLDRAEQCFRRSIELKKEFKTQNYTWLGMLYIKKEELEKANVALQQALKEGETDDKPFRTIAAYLTMGELKSTLGIEDEALTYYEKARSIANELELHSKELVAQLKIANIFENKKDSRYQECIIKVYHLQKKLQNRVGGLLNELD